MSIGSDIVIDVAVLLTMFPFRYRYLQLDEFNNSDWWTFDGRRMPLIWKPLSRASEPPPVPIPLNPSDRRD